nr:energy-coupling factor ABC transporter permease [Atopomonas sediminilitoris]
MLTESLIFGAWALAVPLLVWAIGRAPWIELMSDSRRQHLLFGCVFALVLLWLVRRDFAPGLAFHFIGLTVVTLLLDWPLALLAGFAGQCALCALGRMEWAALGFNAVLWLALPVLIAQGCALWVERRQPRNLFVYIFLCGFFPAALTALAVALLGLWLLQWGGLALPYWLQDYAGYLWLVMFPEAFINGMLVSALVIFKPEWLETFNRSRYLQAPWRD